MPKSRSPEVPSKRRRRRAPPALSAKEAATRAFERRVAALMAGGSIEKWARQQAKKEQEDPSCFYDGAASQRRAQRGLAEVYAFLRREDGDSSASWRDCLCRCGAAPGGMCAALNIHRDGLGWMNCPNRKDADPAEKERYDAVKRRIRPDLVYALSPARG